MKINVFKLLLYINHFSSKTANQKGVASVEWAVPRSRTDDTIEHHFNNNQLELLQRGKQENYWRLPVTAFQRVLDLDEDEDGYVWHFFKIINQ
jgi:hypothetical protein